MNNWLSASETAQLKGLRFPKRRGDWRLGRWTAKRAVAAYLNRSGDPSTLAAVEIRPAPDGAPEVFLDDEPAAITISLSHCAGTAVCAVMPSPAAVGCDLEMIEQRSSSFFDDYFTVEEQALVLRIPEADRAERLTLLWSAKESALKALRVGLRADTRSVVVSLADPVNAEEAADGRLAIRPTHWSSLRAICDNGRVFQGWWQRAGSFIYTAVADPSPTVPTPLEMAQRMASC